MGPLLEVYLDLRSKMRNKKSVQISPSEGSNKYKNTTVKFETSSETES